MKKIGVRYEKQIDVWEKKVDVLEEKLGEIDEEILDLGDKEDDLAISCLKAVYKKIKSKRNNIELNEKETFINSFYYRIEELEGLVAKFLVKDQPIMIKFYKKVKKKEKELSDKDKEHNKLIEKLRGRIE